MPSLDASTSFLIAGVALAIFFVLRRPRPSRTAKEERRHLARLRSPAEKCDGHERPLELLQWEVEMHDIARRLKAELDSKLAALQAVVIQAKRESERLEAAIRRAEALDVPAPPDSLAIFERLGEPAALENTRSLARAAENLAARPSGVADPFAGQAIELALSNLAAQGLSPPEIARRLKLPLGEVEFRLNLIAR